MRKVKDKKGNAQKRLTLLNKYINVVIYIIIVYIFVYCRRYKLYMFINMYIYGTFRKIVPVLLPLHVLKTV